MGRQGKDYAKVLGLLSQPTEEEVKRAFRRLALKYHPDKVLTREKKFSITPFHFPYYHSFSHMFADFLFHVTCKVYILQNDSEWAEEKFKEINEAYEALLAENRSPQSWTAESERKGAESFKCAGCGKTLKNRHAYKCHLQLYPGHR